MKRELTPELKEKFFALYWGQKVFDDKRSIVTGLSSFHPDFAVQVDAWMVLRSISDLTDQESIEVAKIFNQHEIKKHYNGDVLRAYLIMKGKEFSARCEHYLVISDYLRSKGFAIEFMGHSVESFVESGWVKLVKEVTT